MNTSKISGLLRMLLHKIREADVKEVGTKFGILIFSAITFFSLIAAALRNNVVDFYAFYTGAKILTTDRDNLYNPAVQLEFEEEFFKKGYTADDGFMAFVNLPISAIPFIPFLTMQPMIAEKVAQILTLSITLWVIYRLYKFHRIKFMSWTTVFVASFYPIYGTMHLSQIGVIVFWVLAEMYIAYMERNTVILGILSSLLFLKLQYLPLIFLIFAIYPDRKQFIKISSLCIFILAAVNLMLMSGGLITQYISLVGNYVSASKKFGMGYEFGMDIYSLISVLFGNFTNSLDTVLAVGVLLLFIQAIIFLLLLWKRDLYTAGSDIFYFCVILALIMTPHTMPADFIFLLIPLMGLLHRIKRAWFYIITVVILSLFFYFSIFGRQWTHTILLIAYMPLLAVSAVKKPGIMGQKIHNAVKREKSMVGDPGIEPGTARV